MEKLALLGGEKIRTKPFLPHPVLGEEEKAEVNSVLATGLLSGFVAKAGDFFLGGPKVKELEKEFTDYFGTKYAMAVNSATSGLHAAVAACGIGPGDEVIVSPYTMSASASAILHTNAIPVFADVDYDIYCIDPISIRKVISPMTKAIMVVHLFGHPADMDEINKIAKEFKLKVIEDCAQAPGAKYKGRKVGTLGDVAVFSLNMHKTVTTGEGGVVVTNNDEIAEKVRLIRNHGEVCAEDLGIQDISNTLGWNYRMCEIDAAIGIAQMRKLEKLTNHRIELAEYLSQRLSRFPGFTIPEIKFNARHVYFAVPFKYDVSKTGFDRDSFIKALVAEGIPFGAGYVKPIYLEKLFREKICYGRGNCPFSCHLYKGSVNYKQGICPIAEKLHFKELIFTPLCRYPLTKNDMDDIVKAFEKIFENADALRAVRG